MQIYFQISSVILFLSFSTINVYISLLSFAWFSFSVFLLFFFIVSSLSFFPILSYFFSLSLSSFNTSIFISSIHSHFFMSWFLFLSLSLSFHTLITNVSLSHIHFLEMADVFLRNYFCIFEEKTRHDSKIKLDKKDIFNSLISLWKLQKINQTIF